jgi:acetolactate synthase-1/3 small subunit
MKQDEKMIVSILVANQPGALIRTINVFSRRGINIASLNVEVTEDPAVSRIILVTESGIDDMAQIKKMLEKIYDVREVEMIAAAGNLVKKKLMVKSEDKADFGGNVADGLKGGSLLVEITGDSKKLNAFIDFMKPYGMIYTADKCPN